MKTRSRFAPSPTGFMHIGNLRTAIFEYLTAKGSGGDFILRIEDTDQERRVEGSVEFIYDTLKLCNIDIDEGPNNPGEVGPYIQSERLEIYKEYAEELVSINKAYYCFCNEDRLNELRGVCEKNKIAFMYDGYCKKLGTDEINKRIAVGDKYVIRQLMPKDGITIVEDVVYGLVKIENKVLEDQILLKSDGYPTYNFANVIDDHLMKITHVIRGKEYLDQTAKYNLLYEAFGWEKPIYIHVAMVLGSDGTKLSKRNGDASFMDLYNEGFLPEAIVNYLVFLGWSPETNDEVFTMEELIKIFDPKRISKSSSQYDIKKLEWYNAIYIKKLDFDKFKDLCLPFLENAYDLSEKSDEWINHLLKLYQNHIRYGKEIVEVTKIFFNDVEISEFFDENITNETYELVTKTFKEEIENISGWTIENINISISNTKDKTGAKGKELFMPIRHVVSGVSHGPELPDTIYLIGKDTILSRLK